MITPYQKPEDKDSKASNFWSNLAGKLGLSAPRVRMASAAEQKGQRLSGGIQKHSDMARMEPANLQTTPEFWDCECPDDPSKPGGYIHPASDPVCKMCGSHKDESPDARVDEVIKFLGITPTQIEDHGPAGPAREASIQTVSGQAKAEPALIERYSGVFHRAVAELGQSERVKAADRLSRIEADMAAFKDKLNGLGGDKAMGDLVGEVAAKADSLSGACVQLRDKVDGLSLSQAQSIENAFFVLSDAKTEIDKIKGNSGDMGMAMTMEMGLPAEGEDLEVGGDLPEAPRSNEGEAPASAIAGHIPAFVKKAKDAAYDDLRCIHTKLSLVDSMLSALVSELNVSDMLGPAPMSGAGAPPNGMPPMEEMDGEQKAPKPFGASPEDDSEKDRTESGMTAGRKGTTRVAASGDPGDSEPGNTIYKSIDKCRDCVWFESDWTHETYRDKCKHCIHACLGGAIEHFWPRSQQMVMWIPSWTAPEAKEKKAFTGTLSMVQTAEKVSDAVVNIATDIMDRCAHNAVEMGTALIEYFQEPVIAKSMPVLASQVAAEIKRHTGVEIAITASRLKEWGYKKIAAKPVRVPKDFEVQPLKPGENPPGKATCGTCNLSWDDDKPTSWTPAPSGRCPFEYYHNPEPEEPLSPGVGNQMGVPESALGIGGTASADGEVAIACDPTLMHLAKGEKRKIKELREQLQGEKDPAKIKSINDAIDSLYSRMDADKKRKEDRRQQREDKAKKDQEAADKEPAKFPAATAKFKGTLALAAQPYCDACDNVKSLCKCEPKKMARGSLHLAGGKSKCGCGHTGDGSGSQHEDTFQGGHGKCKMCECPKFSWAGEITPGESGQGFKPGSDPLKSKTKDFKVVAVSSNQNSFGLYGVVLMSKDGEAWEAAHGTLELPKRGDVLTVSMDPGGPNWAALGFEIPRQMPKPPQDVIKQVWGQREASASGRSL